MLPDCIAMDVTAAKHALGNAGVCNIEVVITQPPRGGIPKGEARVVRQRFISESACQLVAAYREYLKETSPCM